jgi:hypothetical protein
MWRGLIGSSGMEEAEKSREYAGARQSPHFGREVRDLLKKDSEIFPHFENGGRIYGCYCSRPKLSNSPSFALMRLDFGPFNQEEEVVVVRAAFF